MTNDDATGAGFYAGLPAVDSFADLADPAAYRPVPAGWVLGLADIVRSTDAIAAGRYKQVNTAAAAVIAAVSNALPGVQIPFVFGGDGASFALAPEHALTGRTALARTAAWISENFDLDLRVAMVEVDELRRGGHDLRLARFTPTPDLSYAMFSGGALAHAEARMKSGDVAIPPLDDGTGPDLTGLTCRFSEQRAKNGVILSLIVMAPDGGDEALFRQTVTDILELVDGEVDAGRPVTNAAAAPDLAWLTNGYRTEVRTSGARTGRSRLVSAVAVALRTLLAYVAFRLKLSLGGFDPERYLREFVGNSDFRKFDDALRMTLDCMPATADRIEALLVAANRRAPLAYGLHRQDAALVTCFVPAPSRSDHVHFIDGAAGGYAMAAQAMKRARAAAPRPGSAA
ncbi:adenylate cyclase [Aureimonas sp. Leaf454]|uniref:DUF3095 family protein n=1 Tax=Aureimonas sp. Leaf454 TaxID=1736381 RepID=UPI0006F67D2B|nr:DUF3095 family protein [Aureimonas sp. Leaf454]KQT47529.1 adenylate cyclase [Aureimonas sp. Leaf454]